jgi:hypothetical protein
MKSKIKNLFRFHFSVKNKETSKIKIYIYDQLTSQMILKNFIYTRVFTDFKEYNIKITFKDNVGTIDLTIKYIPNNDIGKIMKKCIIKGEKYEDLDFNVRSLKKVLGDMGEHSENLTFSKFERPTTFCKTLGLEPDIFLGGIEPSGKI